MNLRSKEKMNLLDPKNQIENKIEIEQFYYQQNEVIQSHCSLWGDFNLSLNGLLEFQVGDAKFLSPPNYAIWIPPHTEHRSLALDHAITHYICIRIHPSLCQNFSHQCKTITTTHFFQQCLTEYLKQQNNVQADADLKLNYKKHLLEIIFDQLCMATTHDHYLPQSHLAILERILEQLKCPTRFQQSLAQILSEFDISERHCARLSQQHLGMSLAEWRNRAKIIFAIAALQQGQGVKKIAYDLGYQHSSSFIAFFKRYTAKTPVEFRN